MEYGAPLPPQYLVDQTDSDALDDGMALAVHGLLVDEQENVDVVAESSSVKRKASAEQVKKAPPKKAKKNPDVQSKTDSPSTKKKKELRRMYKQKTVKQGAISKHIWSDWEKGPREKRLSTFLGNRVSDWWDMVDFAETMTAQRILQELLSPSDPGEDDDERDKGKAVVVE